MTTAIKKILLPACLLAAALPAGCIRDNADTVPGPESGIPPGYAKLNVNLITSTGKHYQTRAGEEFFDRIDDVHLLIFEDTGGSAGIDDTDPLTIRNFYEYGIQQNIYLKKDRPYYIYVIANLDDSNCPNGSVATFFDDVATYGDLMDKYVQFNGNTPEHTGKIVMASGETTPITLSGTDVFTPDIMLQRLQTKFIVNIYNRVDAAGQNLSGVYPSTLSFVDIPRYSYVVEREEDYPEDYPADAYYETATDFIKPVEGMEFVGGDWYTRQTVEYYSFENRRGLPVGSVTNVYDRRAQAPARSSYVKITSLTPGNTLLTYVHAGQGRLVEPPTPSGADNISDYNVERNCIYHFNIYIKGVDNVDIDTRRQYVNQLVTFTLPPDANRIDAHYVDLPSFIIGTVPGYAKLQSGNCASNPDGTLIYDGGSPIPRGWQPMLDTDADNARWLRFSWRDPYNTSLGAINTSLYVNMTNVDGVTGATPKLHFHEYVDNPQKAVIPAVNPPMRTAAIRIGFVEGAGSAAEYDQGVLDNREESFYVPVSQYGLKTIGQVGGYSNGLFTSLLGVESLEEYRLQYYSRAGYPQDDIADGPYWRYTTANAFYNHNQAYDGKSATQAHYDQYRAQFGGVPPIRFQAVTIPQNELYKPFSNTNAADYCMRKNRDENGDGVISGSEMKWYLPTSVQMMQMYSWRNAFKGSGYTINGAYVPFRNNAPDGNSDGVSRFYWTTNETGTSPYAQAVAIDFYNAAAISVPKNKAERYPVRCVRDIEGTLANPPFYTSGGKVVADLTQLFPPDQLVDPATKVNNSNLNKPENNTLASKFVISRWYITSGNNHTGSPLYVSGNNAKCENGYSESGYGGTWYLPSQQELSFMYAYSGMINALLAQIYPGGAGSTTYGPLTSTAPSRHWAITNIGNSSTYWSVDFASGYAETLLKNSTYQGYFRCVTYTTANLPPD